MGKISKDAEWRLLAILALVVGIPLGAVLTEPLANFFKSTGLPMWSLLISIIGLAALFFGLDAYLAHRRGERFSLRVSNPGQPRRASKAPKTTQRIMESRGKTK